MELFFILTSRRHEVYTPIEAWLVVRLSSRLLYVPAVMKMAYSQGQYYSSSNKRRFIWSITETEVCLMEVAFFLITGLGSRSEHSCRYA